MKKNKLFALLFCAAAFASVAVAETDVVSPLQEAVALATDSKASMDSICVAAAAAVKDGKTAPTEVFVKVIASRESWTSAQVAALYKSILMASPALSASFVDDVKIFEKAGKPTTVEADAPEGVKLLAALYGTEISGVSADAVLASVVAGAMGPAMASPVAPLRDVTAGSATRRRTQPSKPTPPPASYEN